MDDHEVIPNFEEENMEYHDEGDADDDISIQHDTNMITAYRPPTDSFYANTWENMAIAEIFGDWEESYQRLRKLLLAYLDQDLGTQYNYHTIPRPYENSALLRYVYWAFAPCIAAFQYCRPVISIDGTHLYANGICIISDRHKGIKNAIRQWPRGRDGTEQVYHRYCLRHVASNFNRCFDDPILKALALKAGYATHEAKFESIMQIIKEAEINLLRGVDPTDRHVARCARGLPIAAMVEFTWSKLVAYFHDRHKKITEDLSRGKVCSDYAMEIYNKNAQKTAGHTVRNFNHETGVYQVLTPYNDHRGGGGNHSHEVHVFDRICGYGKWQNLKIPCSHAIKVLQGLHLNATSYIDPCYSLNNAIHTYSHNFVVPKLESLWRDVRGPWWVPDPQLLRAKGRPVASRIRNEMDRVR
ncbi:uncharacterized protein LOC142620415 [Castanea sativa]|uniref:uncharacterized protein LOC142620415 n=1 Tax=Castanea sativa TaxID=21020 RepID=UPI003F650978